LILTAVKRRLNQPWTKAMPPRDPSDLLNDQTVNDLLRRMPPTLYKYSGVSGDRLERMRKLVVESELYFARPSSFNDPLDCRVAPRFDASTLLIEQHWRRVAKRNSPARHPSVHRPVIRKMLTESRTPEGQARLTNQMFESLDQNGVVCLAKDPANMLLWSYYAEGHAGVAVRFNLSLENLIAFGRSFIPVEVQYQSEFPDINFYKSTTTDFILTILGTKSIAWKHEQEWRLVIPGFSGCVRVPPRMINGVILGMKTSRATEAAIRGWIAGRLPRVELLRVENRQNSFELQIVKA
jgi:Protein of unknown function (DUF2971)